MKQKQFPYEHLQSIKAWGVVEDAIDQLVRNKDLVETTARRYVVGFILKQLDSHKLLKEK